MVSPVLTEAFYTGAFLVREANGYFSRDPGLMANASAADVQYQGGLVLSSGNVESAAAAPIGANVGNGAFGAIAVVPGTAPGAYVLNFESPTAFTVEGPNGTEIGHGIAGAAFAAGGLGFTFTAGGTAQAAGDSYAITVTPPAGPGTFVPYTGVLPAVAVLFNRLFVSAGSTRRVTVVTRMAEVNGAELQWDASVTGSASVAALQAAALQQLAALGIVAR